MVEQKTQTLAAKRRWGAKTNIIWLSAGCRRSCVVPCGLKFRFFCIMAMACKKKDRSRYVAK